MKLQLHETHCYSHFTDHICHETNLLEPGTEMFMHPGYKMEVLAIYISLHILNLNCCQAAPVRLNILLNGYISRM